MTDAQSGTVTAFRVGQVISRSFSAFFANIVNFIPLAIVASLPIFVVALIVPGGEDAMMAGNEEDMMAEMGPMLGGVLVVSVVSMVTYLWLSAGVTYGVVSHLRGRKAGGIEILVRSLSSVPSLLLLTLVVIVAFAILFLLNFIPILGTIAFSVLAVWLYTVYWVVVPAIVVEGGGPFVGLGRSAALTKGHRWPVLGVIVLWIIISFVIAMILGMIVAGVGAAGAGGVIALIVNAIVQVILMGLGASVAAVGYHDLRVMKEGVGTEEIARVFD